MNITVCNGSPRGPKSVTMQYFYYLEKLFPEHTFTYVHGAWRISRYQKDQSFFDEAMSRFEEADIILWGFPLYVLMVSSRIKQFIELIFDRKRTSVFKGTYSGTLTTSIHFFDNTAHEYIRAVSDDLGMNHVDFFPAKMNDLMDREMRRALVAWMSRIVDAHAGQIRMPRLYAPVRNTTVPYEPAAMSGPVHTDKRVTVLTDSSYGSDNVRNITDSVKAMLPGAAVIDLAAIKMGPCIGCYKCGLDNVCTYEGTDDDFLPLFREHVEKADILVYVQEIRDRYFGYNFQLFLERSFARTHQPYLAGKHILFIASGPLSENQVARNIIQGYFETMKATLVSCVSDEGDSSGAVGDAIREGIEKTVEWSHRKIVRPQTFLGIAGIRIFRDEIFEKLNMLFQGDH
ncbi:MAG: NAD(P)H-dependent oxidoreductase, partial [Spirochaetota bacterium]